LTLAAFAAAAPLALAGLPSPGRSVRVAAAPRPPAIRFAREIQPLLSDNCFQCHGPDANARAANLRLDTEEGIRRVFAAGKPEVSPAFLRITAKDPARRMPRPARTTR
jgi:mono/diheme cytochrome c family protein